MRATVGGHVRPIRATGQGVRRRLPGHAEVVRVTFDPKLVSYRDLLDVFFVIHDPTTLNRQGNDIGTQYRSAIFYHSPEQKRIAEEAIQRLAEDGLYQDRVVTEVTPAGPFYVAEDYHQEYFANNARQPYCMAVVAPKVARVSQEVLGEVEEVTRRRRRPV